MKRRSRTAATLPEELVLEILARVTDVPALFRCATACKRWRRLIADPLFLRDRWPKSAHHPLSYLLGFFVTRTKGMMRPVLAPAFVPLPRSATGSVVSFPPGFDGLLDRTLALASRGGLLLVRRKEECQGHGYILRSDLHLAVCDPISRTYHVLPTLICDGSLFEERYAILTDADVCSTGQQPLPGFSTSFKVIVLITRHGFFTIHTFSSGDPSWSTETQRFEQPCDGPPALGPLSAAVVCHGAPHWLAWSWVGDVPTYYALGVSAGTSHVFITKISKKTNYFHRNAYGFPCLSVTAEGMLSLLCLHKDGRRLETWTRQDNKENKDGDSEWLPSPVIELNLPKQRQIYHEAPYVCLAEKNGVLLIKDNSVDAERVYLADIKTGAPIEKVTDSFYDLSSNAEIVPFEVDLLAFFISRLRLGSE